jgi:hypothetical protein
MRRQDRRTPKGSIVEFIVVCSVGLGSDRSSPRRFPPPLTNYFHIDGFKSHLSARSFFPASIAPGLTDTLHQFLEVARSHPNS